MTNLADITFHEVEQWYWDTPSGKMDVLVARLYNGQEVRIGLNKNKWRAPDESRSAA